MSREHVNFLRDEIKSERAIDSDTYEILRKKIVRTFMNAVEGAPRHDYDSRLIREFNNKCDQLGHTDLKIEPTNAGFTYTGKEDGVPTGIFIPSEQTGVFVNPNFTGMGTTAQPNRYQELIENFNGQNIGIGTNRSEINGPFYFHSPYFVSTTDFKSLLNASLMSTESYHLIDDGQTIGYGDEGGFGEQQDRVLKMFGFGDTLIDFNKNFSRLFDQSLNYTTTPISCIANTPGMPNSGEFSTGHWAKYEIVQRYGGTAGSAAVPDGATKCTFGGFVKTPIDDPLRELNFGGFYIRQNKSSKDYIDVVQVKGSDFAQNQSMISQTSSYVENAGASGVTNWGNGRSTNAPSNVGSTNQQLGETFSSNGVKVRLLQSKLQTECREWTPISGTFDLQAGTSRRINFQIFYAENISYLDGDGVNAGSVHYARPFLIFF